MCDVRLCPEQLTRIAPLDPSGDRHHLCHQTDDRHHLLGQKAVPGHPGGKGQRLYFSCSNPEP